MSKLVADGSKMVRTMIIHRPSHNFVTGLVVLLAGFLGTDPAFACGGKQPPEQISVPRSFLQVHAGFGIAAINSEYVYATADPNYPDRGMVAPGELRGGMRTAWFGRVLADGEVAYGSQSEDDNTDRSWTGMRVQGLLGVSLFTSAERIMGKNTFGTVIDSHDLGTRNIPGGYARDTLLHGLCDRDFEEQSVSLWFVGVVPIWNQYSNETEEFSQAGALGSIGYRGWRLGAWGVLKSSGDSDVPGGAELDVQLQAGYVTDTGVVIRTVGAVSMRGELFGLGIGAGLGVSIGDFTYPTGELFVRIPAIWLI